jgi:hypothetical protein
VFQLAISQLTLKFEGVANTGIGEFLRLSMATKLEEVSETVKSRRQMLWHQRLDLSYG